MANVRIRTYHIQQSKAVKNPESTKEPDSLYFVDPFFSFEEGLYNNEIT
jgi:hypothetical protein